MNRQEATEITHASSTLPKPSTKFQLHDASNNRYSTLPIDAAKSHKTRPRSHVQFNDTPTILNFENRPLSTNFEHSSHKSPSPTLKSAQSQITRPKVPPPAPPFSPDSEILITDQIPPPINLNTLPPRSSLVENIPFEIVPPTITSQSDDDKPISIIGDMMTQKEPISQSTDPPVDKSILVSATYSNLPSPRSVPAPLEVLSNPIPSNFMTTRPIPGQYYMVQPSATPFMYTEPVQFVPMYPVSNQNYSVMNENFPITDHGFPSTSGIYPEKSSSPVMSYLSSTSSTPLSTQNFSIIDQNNATGIQSRPEPMYSPKLGYSDFKTANQMYISSSPNHSPSLYSASSTPDIRSPPPVPVKPKNRYSVHFNSSNPPALSSITPEPTPNEQRTLRGSSPIASNINTHASYPVTPVKQTKDSENKIYGARIKDLKSSHVEPPQSPKSNVPKMSVSDKKKFFENAMEESHKPSPKSSDKKFSFLSQDEVERMKAEEEKKIASLSRSEIKSWAGLDEADDEFAEDLIESSKYKANTLNYSAVRTAKGEQRLKERLREEGLLTDEDDKELTPAEERAMRAEKRAAWRQARLKSLEQDSIQAQMLIKSMSDMVGTSPSVAEQTEPTTTSTEIDLELRADAALRPSSADFPKLAVRSIPGNTKIRESEKVVDEKITHKTEEYVDELTGEKKVRTVEYVEKLIEREVETLQEKIISLELTKPDETTVVNGNNTQKPNIDVNKVQEAELENEEEDEEPVTPTTPTAGDDSNTSTGKKKKRKRSKKGKHN